MTIRSPLARLSAFSPRTWLLFLLACILISRLAFVLLFGNTLSLQASGYDVYAQNLIAGHGYTRFADLHPDSDLPPLYAYFLAGIYTTLGRTALNVAVVQIVLELFALTLLYCIGWRVGGPLTGWLAVAFSGFFPYLLFQNVSVNDTIVFIFLLVAGILCAMLAIERQTWRWAALAGLAFGLAALTKTMVVLILPILCLWWWAKIGFRRAFGAGLVMGVVVIATILPWIIRNSRLHQTFVLISTNDGSNFYQGNNPCVADYLERGWDAQWVLCLDPVPANLSEVQASAWLRDRALSYLRENPSAWPRLFGIKLWTQWSPELLPREVPPDALKIDNEVDIYHTPLFVAARTIHLLYFTPLWVLGFIGIWRAARDQRPVTPLLAVLLALTFAYVLYHPSTRYRSPGDPFFFVFAAYAVTWLYGVWSRRFGDERRGDTR